jgi:hypothetical protein
MAMEELNVLSIFEKEDCKENTWTLERKRTLESNNTQGDKGHLTW